MVGGELLGLRSDEVVEVALALRAPEPVPQHIVAPEALARLEEIRRQRLDTACNSLTPAERVEVLGNRVGRIEPT